jgi:hypothetical protein
MAMKLKYYLRGAGIGIVATTLVFSIANAVSSANKRLVTGTEQASSESSVLAYTQKDTQAETTKREEETTKEETTTQEETTIGQETMAATEASEPETQGQPQTRAALYLPGDEVQIEIGSGYTATQVADMFLSAGIISDRDGFIGYMAASGNSTKMIAGTHIVKKNDSFENLANVITSR